jgi:hypothetical protein
MTVLSWQTSLTAAAAPEDNAFRRWPVASIDRQPSSTPLASFKENAIPFSSSEPSTQESEAQEAIRTTVSKPISQGADGAGRNDGHGGPSILPESSQCPRHTRDHLLCQDLPLPLAHTGDKKVKRFHFSEIIGRLPYMRATVTSYQRPT